MYFVIIYYQKDNSMKITTKATLTNDQLTSYEQLIDIYTKVNSTKDDEIIIDFSGTKIFECNLLAFISIIIETANNRGISLAIRLPGESKLITASHIIKCFNHYANPQYRKSFFKPRCVIGNPNNKEVEDLLTKYLMESNIKDYSKIQILLSELIANIRMHVVFHSSKCIGYMCSHVDVKSQYQKLYVTIVNNAKSIKEILADNQMEFSNDEDAIRWVLKKTNSTRRDDESGGLGLYLLRKYTYELKGTIIICSGSYIITMDGSCYIPDNDNQIYFKSSQKITGYFHGTSITLCIPFTETHDKSSKSTYLSDNSKIIDVEDY